jgi:hypothetical protein
MGILTTSPTASDCWKVLLFLALMLVPDAATAETKPSKGQTIYVPAYSHIYYGDREQPFYLTVTLSIRNTDVSSKITIVSVDYYNPDGKLIRKYNENPVALTPLSSKYHVVDQSDKAGGSGASFLVVWKADKEVTPPIIETIMISTYTQQGISFSSRGVVIKED